MKTLYILRDHVVQITLAADLVRTAYPGATAVEVSDDYVTSVGATYVLPVTARPATEQDRLNWSTRTLPNKEALHLLNSQLARGVRLLECPATAIVDGITYELNSASPRQFVAVGTDPRGYGIKPKFLVQPQRQTVPAGAKVQFSVVVLAAASLQWRKNGANISGATGVTLEVASAAEADSGAAYDCVATNPVGSTTSDPAILTVGAASGNGTTPPAPSTSLMTFARLSSNGQQATNTDNYTHFNDRRSVVNRAGVPVNQIVLRFSNTAANGASLNNGSQPVTISVGIGPESSVQATGALTRALFPGGGNTYTLALGRSWTRCRSRLRLTSPTTPPCVSWCTAPTRPHRPC
ncbi:hypothetical protein [Pseudorhodoferax sp. Leaf265]|uniref:hypothetical protein n=1 Tax=Pseudorhodoferax sp. Leaf265 TaxID=1736315 RepID=UPI0006F3DF36|nr:hypothetical protein [Pseudorhodoferax sp. Leaf265]KQP19958.1 hypothetical protein ASF45_22955 [Pseudorhodoferax sp. Leaf265]